MQYLRWVAKLVVFLLFLGFGLKNTETVTVRYVLGMEWSAPLSLVMLLCFVAGAALGVIAALSLVYRQRKELASLRSTVQPPTPSRGQPDVPLV